MKTVKHYIWNEVTNSLEQKTRKHEKALHVVFQL